MAQVARVAVESPLPHLDRLFDFSIPEELDGDAVPGCRVRVRFHGRLIGGWLIERGPTHFEGRLQPLQRVSGPAVLTAATARLCRIVADRFAGNFTDVARFAVPPRVAAVEKREFQVVTNVPPRPDMGAWAQYDQARPFLAARSGAASWICHPHDEPFAMLAAVAADTAAQGRASVLVVPDARDVRALHEACASLMDPDQVAVVSGEASNRVRYRTHLEVLAGARPVVIGTRSAVFAPVPDLGLIAVWDDGDDVLAEPQSPGWHAREVAALRAWQEDARVLVGGFARTAATAQWVAERRAVDIRLERQTARDRRFRVEALTEPDADRRRIPGRAFRLLQKAVESGVALVQVPQVGGATALVCARCGDVARCPRCGGGVRPDQAGRARCRSCHQEFTTCGSCGNEQFLLLGAGSRLTAEQLLQGFADVPVLRSDADAGVLDQVEIERGLVVATPGSEPHLAQGYGCLVILDTEVLLARSALRAQEEAARRWMAAIAMTRPDAVTLLVAAQDVAVVQSLVRNDLAGMAETERAERAQAHMPPAYRCVRLRGDTAAVGQWLAGFEGTVLGPLETVGGSEALLLAPLEQSAALLRQVREIQIQRSRDGKPVVDVRVDPVDLGDT
ncbi:MAG: primosome assembly protein PriA [Candidatus Nanopelagicales bacterium]